MRVSINHLEIGDKVRILNNETKDMIGFITEIDYDRKIITVNDLYSANVKDIRLEL